jgi:hypothetical protein
MRRLGVVLLLAAGTACSSDDAGFGRDMFASELQRAGAQVELRGDVSQPFFSVTGRIVSVNAQNVQTFEYRDVAAAEAAASTVSRDGGTIGTSAVSWIATPHFYRRDRLVVLYVGDDANARSLLAMVMGPQFAGR